MRPDEKNRRALRLGKSRAQMHLRSGLGWLHGFPIAAGPGWIDWISIANQSNLAATRMRVDRGRLQRMQMALTTLTSQHADDLEELFDDPQAWLQSAGLILKALKSIIHEGQSLERVLPLSKIPAIARRRTKYLDFEAAWPRLSPLFRSVLWVSSLEADRGTSLIEAVWAEAQGLDWFLAKRPDDEGLIQAVQWAMLHGEGDGVGAATLLHLLSDGRIHSLPLTGLAPYVEKMVDVLKGIEALLLFQRPKRKQQLPQRFWEENPSPANAIESTASTFLTRLAGLDQEKRQAELRLFEIVAEESQFGEWLTFWHDCGPLVKRAEKIVKLPPQTIMSAPPSDLGGLIASLESLQARIPAGIDFPQTWSEIWEVRHRSLEVHLGRFTKAIAAWEPMKEAIPGPRAFVRGLSKLYNLYHFNDINIISILKYFNEAIKQQQDNNLYKIALDKIAKNQCYGDLIEIGLDAIDDADTAPPPKKFWHAYFMSLSFLSSEGIEGRGMVNALKMAANAVLLFHYDIEKIDHFLRHADFKAIKIVGWSSHLSLRILIRLHLLGMSPEKSSSVPSALDNGSHRPPDAVAFGYFLTFAGRHGLENDLRDLTPHIAFEQLVTLGKAAHDASQFVKDLKPPRKQLPGVDARDSQWIQVYPAPLYSALKNLAAFATSNDENSTHFAGKKAAERTLDETFPSREKIECEIAKLSSILDAREPHAESASAAAEEDRKDKKQPLARRLENLKKRLTHPATISSQRMARLNQKLEAAYAQLLYDFWLDHFRDALQSEVRRMLGLAIPPPWLEEAENRRLLAQIMKLDKSERRLGLAILAKRCGPPPWDFADEPENRTYLAKLEALGLDIAHWVNPISPGAIKAPNGQMIEVSFASDPLEVFRMGEYFKTCLGFEGCNFYSTITNFVDVNKHVLFARTDRGTVIGRSLIALTENGWLQTFQAYSHDPAIEWHRIVGQIAQDLAAKMGTVVTPSGEVPSLVAKSWYADPPRLLSDQVSPLEKIDFIAMHLMGVNAETFLERFQEVIRPISLPDFLKIWLLDGNLVGLLFALGEEKMRLLYGPIEAVFAKPDPAQAWWGIVVHARQAGLNDWAGKMFKKHVLAALAPEIKRNGFANDHAAELLLWMADHNPSLALRTLRQAFSPWSPHTGDDEDETDPTKRNLFAMIHAKLGRHRLAGRLMKKYDDSGTGT